MKLKVEPEELTGSKNRIETSRKNVINYFDIQCN